MTLTTGDASGFQLCRRTNSKQATGCYVLAECIDQVCFASVSSHVWEKRWRDKMFKNNLKKKLFFLIFVLSVQKRGKQTAGLILDDIEGYCLIS